MKDKPSISFSTEDLDELKQIHFKLHNQWLSNQDAIDLGYRLLGLVRSTFKDIPKNTEE